MFLRHLDLLTKTNLILVPQWRRNEFEIGGVNFLVVSFTFFGSTGTKGRFGERFRDGYYSLVSFLFAVLLLTVPPGPRNL